MRDAGYRRIPVSSPRGTMWALIDERDHWLSRYRWHLVKGYAVRNGPKVSGRRQETTVSMAREIMGLERGDPREVDHIDRARLNNRRSNLRVVTHADNMRNRGSYRGTSRYRGVSWNKLSGKWRADAKFDYRTKHLGQFASEEAAAAAVNTFWVSRGYEAPNAIPAG